MSSSSELLLSDLVCGKRYAILADSEPRRVNEAETLGLKLIELVGNGLDGDLLGK
jgi:hypothetical protein